MDRRTATAASARKRRRLLTLASVAASVIAIAILIRYEQVALLYVLATFGVASLLITVALANFGEARAVAPPAPFDDSAVLANTAPQMSSITPARDPARR